MQRGFEEGHHKLAQISQRACEIAQKVDENLIDTLSLMDLNFSLDGLGKLYNDLGKACEVSKLAKISGKYVDLAKKFADEVSADWLGLDINPIDDVELEQIACENTESESEEELNESEEELDGDTEPEYEEELDNVAISGVSNDDSKSTNANNASDQEYEGKFPLGTEFCVSVEEQGEEMMFDGPCSKDTSIQNEISAFERALLEDLENYKRANMSYSQGELKPNEAYDQIAATDVFSPEAVDNYLTAYMQSSQGELKPNEAYAFERALLEDLENYKRANMSYSQGELKPNEAYATEVVSLEAIEKYMTAYMPSSQGEIKSNEAYDKHNVPQLELLYHNIRTARAIDNYLIAHMPFSQGELKPNEAYENLSADLNALSEVSESHDGSSSVVSSDRTDHRITAEANNLVPLFDMLEILDEFSVEALQDDTTSDMPSSQVDVAPNEAHVDLNASVEVSKSHDRNSTVNPSDKTDETAAEADNLVNFSKTLESGVFENVDLKDDWEDDIDYDLDLVSYYESNKKPSKNKLVRKVISRWRCSMKSRLGEIACKPDANSADSDWEIL